MSNKALKLAMEEEHDRRLYNFQFLNSVAAIIIDKIGGFDEKLIHFLEKGVSEVLSNDILMIEELNQYIADHPLNSTWSLKTNKNKEAFTCARAIVQDKGIISKYDVLQENYPVIDGPILLGGEKADVQGTSALNCLHTYFITILYFLSSIFSDEESAKSYMKESVFNVDKSPLAQTTMLPEHIMSADIYPKLQKWLYFYKDEMSPPQGELIFTTLGYAYGGSREDTRYNSKLLRAEDCSSAVAKWVGSKEAFSTWHMKRYYNGTCDMVDPNCQELAKTLLPFKGEFADVMPGMVYAFANGAHTGIVTERITDACFRSLSYSRDIPKVEGLGYNIECLPCKEYLFFSVIGDSAIEINVVDQL